MNILAIIIGGYYCIGLGTIFYFCNTELHDSFTIFTSKHPHKQMMVEMTERNKDPDDDWDII